LSARHLLVDAVRFNKHKLAKSALALQSGAVIVVPTDTNYELVCKLGDMQAINRIKQLRNLSDKHLLSLFLPSFQSLGKYAIVNNQHFRTLKNLVPGPYSFILPATKTVPSVFAHKKRKTIGIRIPDCNVLQAFQTALGEPLIGCSLKEPGSSDALSELESCLSWLNKVVDLVVDCGPLEGSLTTMLDMSTHEIVVAREGIGDTSFLNSNNH